MRRHAYTHTHIHNTHPEALDIGTRIPTKRKPRCSICSSPLHLHGRGLSDLHQHVQSNEIARFKPPKSDLILCFQTHTTHLTKGHMRFGRVVKHCGLRAPWLIAYLDCSFAISLLRWYRRCSDGGFAYQGLLYFIIVFFFFQKLRPSDLIGVVSMTLKHCIAWYILLPCRRECSRISQE